jgi:hypothetical protein
VTTTTDITSAKPDHASLILSQSFPAECAVLNALKSETYGGAYRTYQHFLIIQRICQGVGLNINFTLQCLLIHYESSSNTIILTTMIILAWAGMSSLGTFNHHKGVIPHIDIIASAFESKAWWGQLPPVCHYLNQ